MGARPASRSLALLCLLAGLPLARAVRAQEPTPPPAPPPAAESVRLQFRHRPGQLQRFRSNARLELAMTAEGGAEVPPIPLAATMDFVYTEKVIGAREGTGTLSFLIDSLTMRMEVMGRTQIMRVRDGKVSLSVDGRPVPSGQLGALRGLDGSLGLPVKKPALFRRTATGALAGGGEGATERQLIQAFGGSMPWIVMFPDRPVSVGETWETTMRVPVPMLAGAPGADVKLDPMEIRYAHTLKAIEVKNGRPQALIETLGASTAPPTAEGGPRFQFSGTTRFDVARGAVLSGSYEGSVGLRVPLPVPMPPAAGAGEPQGGPPQAMRVDTTLRVTLREVPVSAPTAPASRRAPARAPKRR